ncbi:MAG: sugar-binding protein, partial [Armatimonadota bacterium]
MIMTRALALTLLLVFIASSLALAGPSGARRMYVAPEVVEGLALTPGGLSDVPAMEPFYASSGEEADVQTRAWALQDEDALQVVVVCREPEMDALVAEQQPAEGDVEVFTDDCIEIFVSPTGSEDDYFHFATNALGAKFNERVKDRSWDAEWHVDAHREDGRWWLLVTLPYDTLEARPGASAMWWFNVSRQRQAGGSLQLSSWSDTGSNFHNVPRWGRLVLTDRYAEILDTYVRTPWRERTGELTRRAQINADLTGELDASLSPLEDELAPVWSALDADSGPADLAELSELLTTGETALERLQHVEADLGTSIQRQETSRAIRRMAGGHRIAAWPVRAITNRRIMPAPEPPERVGGTIRMRACPGEIEPASFVVYPVGEEMTVLPVLSDLEGPGLGLRARHFDIHSIKRWYQAGEGGTRFPFKEEGVRALVPELLLKDDSLVRVDHTERENYVKLRKDDGDEYLWISFPRPEDARRDPYGRANLTDEPIYDTAELQPVTIP